MPRRAFTIIELLVSITIIGLLLGAVALNVNSSQANKRDAQRISDVMMIAKALDASTLTSRGIYPGKVGGDNGSTGTFCVKDIDLSTLDLTAFPGDRMPSDPRPTGTGCGGYVYYVNKAGVTNFATVRKVAYILEIELEKDKVSDEKNLKTASELALTLVAGAPIPNPNAYFLVGPYCGENCPSTLNIENGGGALVDNPFDSLSFTLKINPTEHEIPYSPRMEITNISGGDPSKEVSYTFTCEEGGTVFGPTTDPAALFCPYSSPGRRQISVTLTRGTLEKTLSDPFTATSPALTLLAPGIEVYPPTNTEAVSTSNPFSPTITVTPRGTLPGPYSYTYTCGNGQATITTNASTYAGCKYTAARSYIVSVTVSSGVTPSPVATQQVDVKAIASPDDYVCSTNNQGSSFDLSVPYHHSDHDKSGKGPEVDVMESNPFIVNLGNISGSTLRITDFSIDDIAMITKSNIEVSDVYSSSGQTIINKFLGGRSQYRTRTIHIPDDAFIIYDSNDPNFSSGDLNDMANTVYEYKGKSFTISGGLRSRSVKSVYADFINMGVPMISYKELDLNKLKSNGYFDSSSNQLSFKVMSIAHGAGYATLKGKIDPCNN